MSSKDLDNRLISIITKAKQEYSRSRRRNEKEI